MTELELEKTYLLKALPAHLKDCRSEVIRDAYIPGASEHPVVRLRQRGERYEITKKEPNDGVDSSRQTEHTIPLSKDEFEALLLSNAKTFVKRRYYCTIDGHKAEVDVYLEDLRGLVVADFEFATENDMEAFVEPKICLADVTQEHMIAGGILAGKKYDDLRATLEKYGYKPLHTEDIP